MKSKAWTLLGLCLMPTLLWAQSPAGDERGKVRSLQKALEGREYIRMGKDVTCKSNSPERTVLKSWANRISVKDGALLVWGPVCNDSPESIPLAQAARSVFVSADLKRILYKGEVLAYAKELPKLCEAGPWCPVEQPTK